jgi:hypothetical protein
MEIDMTRLLTFLIATISWVFATVVYAAVEGDYYIEAALNDTETAHLVFMREEEKLARDTYITLNQTWGLRVFSNIASSEQTHMDTMLAKLDCEDLHQK